MSKTTMIQHTGEGGPVRGRTDEPDKAATVAGILARRMCGKYRQKDVKMNVQIETFLNTFNKIYSELYDTCDNVAGFNEAVSFFDEFTKQQPEFVQEFVKFRGDFITSDREAASFAFALSDYDLI